MKEWDHKDEWRLWGNGFMVSVVRHTRKPFPDYYEGPNRWAVYAYVYPKHPHFDNFEGNDMWQDAAQVMPLHLGPSYLRWHYDDDMNPCSVQVGADYHHHGDDCTHIATKDEAWSIFADAERLFDWLRAHTTSDKSKGEEQ